VGLFERLFDTQDAADYVRSLELLLAADASDVVPMVTVPCASISGSDDQYAPPASVAAFLAALPAAPAAVVLPGVGHMPFFEAPVEFARLVRGFLETVPGWASGMAGPRVS
jgi:pimeloyl-ACP methyl ester carboxylesterase